MQSVDIALEFGGVLVAFANTSRAVADSFKLQSVRR
jgi:hypothetical protein